MYGLGSLRSLSLCRRSYCSLFLYWFVLFVWSGLIWISCVKSICHARFSSLIVAIWHSAPRHATPHHTTAQRYSPFQPPISCALPLGVLTLNTAYSQRGDFASSSLPSPFIAFFLLAITTAANASRATSETTPNARKEGTYGVEKDSSQESTSQSGKSFL
jgi:hypothetical protein